MKRILSLMLCLLLLAPLIVSAEEIDLSAYTFEELVQLRQRISQELITRPEWKEVTVPQGVWKVGEDIPAGHWMISAVEGGYTGIIIGTALDQTGHEIDLNDSEFYFGKVLTSKRNDYFDPLSDIDAIDLMLYEGTYVIIDLGPAVFSPYTGKPSLGF